MLKQTLSTNGFTGTEAEWLESLKGKDGKDGTSATGTTGSCMINTPVTITTYGDGIMLTFDNLKFSLSFSGDGIILSNTENDVDTQVLYVIPSAFSGGE